MKTVDPWNSSDYPCDDSKLMNFEDSFIVNEELEEMHSQCDPKLLDSQQYLDRLYARLKNVQGGNSKKDLVNSLSQIKEDTIARFITAGGRLESEEEVEVAANPLIRHITPHLQAMAASELVHLLKADVLQVVTSQQHEETNELDNLPQSPGEDNGQI